MTGLIKKEGGEGKRKGGRSEKGGFPLGRMCTQGLGF
jgi:hypothetical protein